MLAFISFWRAAAIVLNDLASSSYDAGGEAEVFIGRAAPWCILGGVYRRAKEGWAGRWRSSPFPL
jgi:hypothetical protein